ncbi:MAG: TlpA family protein disulfide reductase [Clostridia bacterium]|nr:TlpA family protein disulfide reductase [Clostridia bacterium]
MKNKSLIIIAIIFVAVIALAAIIYPSLSEKATEALETTTNAQNSEATAQYPAAQDIKIFDAESNEIKLSEFYGKPIILNFWATWCGYCIQEMPDFEEAYKNYGDDIHFLIVNTDDGIKTGEAFIEKQGYTFPTYYDLEYSATITYGITGIPRTIAIDADGNIRYNRSGMLTAEALEDIIKMIK